MKENCAYKHVGRGRMLHGNMHFAMQIWRQQTHSNLHVPLNLPCLPYDASIALDCKHKRRAASLPGRILIGQSQ